MTPYSELNREWPKLLIGDYAILKSHSVIDNYHCNSHRNSLRMNFFDFRSFAYQLKCNQQSAQLSLPGRGHGGGPRHPGCAAEKGGSTLCAAASSPVSPPESPQQSPLAPLASGSDVCINENTADIRRCSIQDQIGDSFTVNWRLFSVLMLNLVITEDMTSMFIHVARSYNL